MGWDRKGGDGRGYGKGRKGGRDGREEGRRTWSQPSLCGVDGIECDDKGAVAHGDLLRVVPFLVGGCAVMCPDEKHRVILKRFGNLISSSEEFYNKPMAQDVLATSPTTGHLRTLN